ncbi:MAG: bifunctional glutamate N-acetyltransferase/amino-acid acetyltransferase ArgJ [Candidatus Abyssobacteria bacterium SURF_5]|uniref:Arginine biosynthesis bifunctional protein ArgJ n=1 Tax=Abyssobacteria bacterium (strain SURF_5) TaxID=2093360 RepID=A0A3A4NPZ9_ABYX5|nr:MAG: bifunctional glutamate N-acetyltransferase/amino-acid acetyltransferase ArgJ [Candidatus Abyssubacteria bacterium SURF_5]
MLEFQEVSGGITAPVGFRAGGSHCGIKKNGNPDLALLFSERPAAIAGMFTRNIFKSAAVLYSQRIVRYGVARAVVVNSGNANAATGARGERDAEAMAEAAAESLGISSDQVAVASTGTIGVLLPIDRIKKGIGELSRRLDAAGGEISAQAIMTTDTFPKSIAVTVPLSTGKITIGGMAKGAGMICPDMATMLAFVTTDAAVELSLLSRALREAVETTFNSITVDGDGSTNDTILILANGASGTPAIDRVSDDYRLFCSALEHVCAELAKMLVRDGEGATKLVEVNVGGAERKMDAEKIAKTIANSLLVKTAIFGSDANWGRIMAAAGRAGVALDPGRIEIRLGDLLMFEKGSPVPFDEDRAKRLLSEKEIQLHVNLGMGGESATVYTCDLTYDYIKINASYRT